MFLYTCFCAVLSISVNSRLGIQAQTTRALTFLNDIKGLPTRSVWTRVCAQKQPVLALSVGNIRESVDSLCRGGADVQPDMQYLSKSRITSPQTR